MNRFWFFRFVYDCKKVWVVRVDIIILCFVNFYVWYKLFFSVVCKFILFRFNFEIEFFKIMLLFFFFINIFVLG